jgi:hypothetical protein
LLRGVEKIGGDMKSFAGDFKSFAGRLQKFCGAASKVLRATSKVLRESVISPQKKHTDYVHLFSAEGAKTPIFVAENPKSPKNVAAE